MTVKYTANSNTHLVTMAIDANYYDAKLYNYLDKKSFNWRWLKNKKKKSKEEKEEVVLLAMRNKKNPLQITRNAFIVADYSQIQICEWEIYFFTQTINAPENTRKKNFLSTCFANAIFVCLFSLMRVRCVFIGELSSEKCRQNDRVVRFIDFCDYPCSSQALFDKCVWTSFERGREIYFNEGFLRIIGWLDWYFLGSFLSNV